MNCEACPATWCASCALRRALTAERLAERCAIQGRDLTVLDAVFHVTEHFAYHLGQIIFVSKMCAPGGVHLYEDAGGMARPLWHT